MTNELKTTKTSLPSSSAFEDELRYSGEGGEEVASSDLVQPFWRLLQSLSPECDRNSSQYLPDARPGMWMETSTRDLFEEILFIPARYRSEYIEWKPRNEGGGLVQNYGVDDRLWRDARVDPTTNARVTDEGTEIVQTGTWYGLVAGGIYAGDKNWTFGLNRPAILTLAKTQFKISRQWVSACKSKRVFDPNSGHMVEPPWRHYAWQLSNQPGHNKKGSWCLAKFTLFGRLDVLDDDGVPVLPNYSELLRDAKNVHRVSAEILAKPKTIDADNDEGDSPF